jgi:hypothetical protein
MFRCASKFIILVVVLTAIQANVSFAQSEKEEETPFQWLEAKGETSGIKYATQKLQPLSTDIKPGPPVEIEQKEVKVDSQTTRVTRQIYNNSINDGRVLTETVVEEIKKLPGDRVRAVRTTSRRDVNGQIRPVERDVQEIDPVGTNAYQVKRTFSVSDNGSRFVEEERIQQTERRKGDENVEIDRTRYVTDLNGKWSAVERRISQNSLSKNQISTDEQVYRNDVNNRFNLAEQIESTERKDSKGQTHRESEFYTKDLEGRFQLSRRMTIFQTPLEDGQQQTTETVEETNPAEPNGGLMPVQKIVEDMQVLSPSETKKELEVFKPDYDGKMQSVYSQESVEVK